MTLLRKYKLYILVLLTSIFFLTSFGGFCYFESNRIIKHYSGNSDGIIAIADVHLKKDALQWDFEFPLNEEYVEELIHVYKFSNKGFRIQSLNLISPKGKIIFSNDSSLIGKSTSQQKFSLLSRDNINLFIVNKRKDQLLSFPKGKLRIDTYSPILVNNKLMGYVQLEYTAKVSEIFYIYYENILLPLLVVLLVILFIFLVLYIKRHILIEKETENSQKMMFQLFNNASDGIVLLDKEKNVLMMNKAMEIMVGSDSKEFSYPHSCEQVLRCHSNDGSLCGKDCPVSRETESNLIEFEMITNEGNRLHVSASKSNLKNEVTEEIYEIMLIRDETSRKAQELQLQTLEEFERLMNSPLDVANLSCFIVNKVKNIAICDEVYIYKGNTYETSVLINSENMQVGNLLYDEDIVVQSYSTKKIQKVDLSNHQNYQKFQNEQNAKTLISIPLIVNSQIVGVLLLVYKNKKGLDIQQEELLRKFAIDLASLMKVYLLMLDTNERKELNEKLYNLEHQLQTCSSEKDIPEVILNDIQNITGIDFIVYRSSKMNSLGMSGIGTILNSKTYKESGDMMNFTIKWGRSLYIEDFNNRSNMPVEFTDFSLVSDENLVTIYSVPLIYNNQVLGAILFGCRKKVVITEEKKNVLRSIVNMLAVHIENKNLYRQIENEATIIERQRISREIHDGLAQNIGFINIQLHRLRKMILKNELTKAIQEIEVVKEAVEDSYVELRETIDQLSDLKGYKQSLEDWISEYSFDFEKTHGINVKLDIRTNEKIILNEEQKVQLTRVVQEIFNNIRKHAKAKNVHILCLNSNNDFRLMIEDDGVGFDMQTNHKRKYGGNGLYILQERIQSIQGELHIDSSIQQGTKIEIQIPIAM